MTEQLADKKCVPCRGGVPPLKGAETEKLHRMIPRWTVVKDHHIQREYKFPDFRRWSSSIALVRWPRSKDIIRISCWRGARPKSRYGRIRLTA
jgi:hypothetical protein